MCLRPLRLYLVVTDKDLNVEKLKGYKGDVNAVKINAQAPYKAMAHMLVMLSKGTADADP